MQVYRIAQPKIVYEVLNTEVIAIDFDTGTYYALLHVAKLIWLLLEQEIPPDQIVKVISEHYRLHENEVAQDVKEFMRELLKARLIESIEKESHTPGPLPKLDSHGFNYEAPRVVSYMDIQDLLVLDPIHEVVETGWPDKA